MLLCCPWWLWFPGKWWGWKYLHIFAWKAERRYNCAFFLQLWTNKTFLFWCYLNEMLSSLHVDFILGPAAGEQLIIGCRKFKIEQIQYRRRSLKKNSNLTKLSNFQTELLPKYWPVPKTTTLKCACLGRWCRANKRTFLASLRADPFMELDRSNRKITSHDASGLASNSG